MKDEPVDGETLWLRMAGAREFLDDFFKHGNPVDEVEVALENVKLHYYLTEDQVEELRLEYWRRYGPKNLKPISLRD